ncbi:MAG: cytochrome C oxidase Cbb3, partial [Pseudomonadota bacterium]
EETIVAQIVQPQHGVMPPWQQRLSDETIKQLAVYVHSLGGGEKAASE